MPKVNKAFVKRLFPPREAWSHKGQYGRLLVIGGSLRYSGSPAFAALAAIRSGADLTLVAAPRRAADIIAGMQPDLITEPLDCDYIDSAQAEKMGALIGWADAVLVGGGLDRKPETHKAIGIIAGMIAAAGKPCVLDAEALRASSRYKKALKANFVLTPHENEFMALGGGKPEQGLAARRSQVSSLAKRLGAVVLLKGHFDIISDGMESAVNRTGNPYMAKGGTGDTLAGICGALLARGIKPFDAACAAAWINGAAGDLAVKERLPGFYVSEMLDCIPRVIWG